MSYRKRLYDRNSIVLYSSDYIFFYMFNGIINMHKRKRDQRLLKIIVIELRIDLQRSAAVTIMKSLRGNRFFAFFPFMDGN